MQGKLRDHSGFYYLRPQGIGAGYTEYFALFRDGTWLQSTEHPCHEHNEPIDELVLARRGQWSVTENRLAMIETERDVYRGGRFDCQGFWCEPAEGQLLTLRDDLVVAVEEDRLSISIGSAATAGARVATLWIEGTLYFNLGAAEDFVDPPAPCGLDIRRPLA
ncbi:MAG: hypothetical protein HYV63_01590 [Candidatus Schekmanbacteria bacterium]|nr:hypothetical protein [Candidatus Schekmanbacteria bacterium]